MRDIGREHADKELEIIERRVHKIFTDCGKSLKQDIEQYFARFAERDAEMQAALAAGTYPVPADMTPEEYYRQWRLNQYLRGQHLITLQDKCAAAVANAHEIAIEYTNDRIATIYASNRNFTAFTMDLLSRGKYSAGTDFELWDEATVRRLIKNQELNLMPRYPQRLALKRGIDLSWTKKQITAQITQSIIQGHDISTMRKALQSRIVTMSDASARRAARTAVTAAENAGRLDTMTKAQELGIKYRKRWVCTKDKRTRYSHQRLDGKVVNADELFKSPLGGYLSAPGDNRHGAKPADLYNCRCRVVTVEKAGIEPEKRQMRVRNPATGRNEIITANNYDDWLEWVKQQERART